MSGSATHYLANIATGTDVVERDVVKINSAMCSCGVAFVGYDHYAALLEWARHHETHREPVNEVPFSLDGTGLEYGVAYNVLAGDREWADRVPIGAVATVDGNPKHWIVTVAADGRSSQPKVLPSSHHWQEVEGRPPAKCDVVDQVVEHLERSFERLIVELREVLR